MLDVTRLISYHNQNLKEGKWEKKMGSLLRGKTLGIIGLGNMGGPMSANLVKAGHDVRGFDIVPSKVEQAAAHGVVAAHSNADAAENADVVFTMLPTGREVREVLVEKDKLIETVSGESSQVRKYPRTS